MNKDSLEGRVGIVTGGARGIGAAIARALHTDGATVAISGLESDTAVAATLVAQLGGDRIKFYRSDVGEYEACEALVASVLRDYGRIDILVNNAGITRDKTIRKLAVEDWRDVIRTN